MKSGRDEAARGSIPGCSPRPDRKHRKTQPTTCYTVVCVKTAVEIGEESRGITPVSRRHPGHATRTDAGTSRRGTLHGRVAGQGQDTDEIRPLSPDARSAQPARETT